MKKFLARVPEYWKAILAAIPFVALVVQAVTDYLAGHPGKINWVGLVITVATVLAVALKGNAPYTGTSSNPQNPNGVASAG